MRVLRRCCARSRFRKWPRIRPTLNSSGCRFKFVASASADGASNFEETASGDRKKFETGDLSMAIKLPIYMDYHATTPVDPRVVETMLPYFHEKFGNATSRNHSFGWTAEEAVENARAQIARLINATPKEIIFTSGATESNNLALKGAAEMYREKGNHIITQVTEHKAILDTCKRLEKYGYEVTYLPVAKDGRIDLDDLRRAITAKTILISIMYANNEIGVIQPIQEIGKIAKEKGVLFHSDGVQALGKIPVDVQRDNIDMIS